MRIGLAQLAAVAASVSWIGVSFAVPPPPPPKHLYDAELKQRELAKFRGTWQGAAEDKYGRVIITLDIRSFRGTGLHEIQYTVMNSERTGSKSLNDVSSTPYQLYIVTYSERHASLIAYPIGWLTQYLKKTKDDQPNEEIDRAIVVLIEPSTGTLRLERRAGFLTEAMIFTVKSQITGNFSINGACFLSRCFEGVELQRQ